MNPDEQPRTAAAQRIARRSRDLARLATVLVPLVPVGVAWVWIRFEQFAPVLTATAGVVADPARVTPLVRFGGFGLNMVPGAIAMYGFWRLRRLFGLFAAGQYFSAEAIRCVRGFGLAALAYGVAAPVARLLITLLVTFSNPPGERLLLIRISSDDLAILFLGGAFYVIAWVWTRAKEISDENAQIV